jgi:hypothetical protein
MEIQALKIFNSIKLILFLNLILGVITVLTACGDLVKESDANACNSAIDARDYGTAKSICTDRKDIASAYMGLAGYDIINLLKSSGSSTKKYDDDNVSGDGLKKDDVSGLSILNLLRLSDNEIDNDTKRRTAIVDSKDYLDDASELLHPHLNDNSTDDPLDTDEILLDTFALAFAMQLNQLILYDNATTSTTTFPDNSTGNLVCDNATARTASELRAMDGHLWTAERDGIQCNQVKSAILALSTDNATKVLDNISNRGTKGGLLPIEIRATVCDPITSLTTYLSKLTDSVNKLTLSGDNTKAITDAKTSTDNLTKTVGCVE